MLNSVAMTQMHSHYHSPPFMTRLMSIFMDHYPVLPSLYGLPSSTEKVGGKSNLLEHCVMFLTLGLEKDHLTDLLPYKS